MLAGVVRVMTNQRIFRVPGTLDEALTLSDLLAQPGCTPVRPGARHREIFARLCRESTARGPLVPGAGFAALAIEHGCEWITCDRDFARFWRHPPA